MTEAALTPAALARPVVTEDWLAVVVGFAIFLLAIASYFGADLIGWVVTTAVWTDASKALAPAAKSYASLGGAGALLATFVALLAVLSAGALVLGADVEEIRRRLCRRLRSVLRQLDHRLLRQPRGGDAGRPGQIRPVLVAEAHQ